jgi:site-specific recombinase XerD
VREGWGLESLRVTLGHSSVATTQVYLHVDETRLAELQAKAAPFEV